MIDSGMIREGVPPGYKQTDVGVIPEEWDLDQLDNLTNRVGSGITPTGGEKVYTNEGRPFVRSQNVGWGSLQLSDLAFITDEIHKTFATSEIEDGDVLLNITGASIGRSAVADTRIAGGNVNQHVCQIRTERQKLVPEYLNYYLLSASGQRQIDSFQAGGNRQGLNYNQIRSFTVPLPPLPEQRAIAAALSDADGLIGALDALIEKKRAIKQAAMQQLLTGKTRLPGFVGEWETKRLGDIIAFLPTANNPRADLNDDGEIGYIHYGDVHAQTEPVLDCNVCVLPFIDRGKIGNAVSLEDGDLIMVDASEDLEGTGKSVEIQGVMGKYVVAGLHTILCRGNHDQWARGFKAYLQFIPAFKLALTRVATGISVYAISKKQIAEIELALPSVSEQEAIVSILSDMDAEIAALERRREKTKQIKQGMMQQLLTGRIRLVEPPEAAA